MTEQPSREEYAQAIRAVLQQMEGSPAGLSAEAQWELFVRTVLRVKLSQCPPDFQEPMVRLQNCLSNFWDLELKYQRRKWYDLLPFVKPIRQAKILANQRGVLAQCEPFLCNIRIAVLKYGIEPSEWEFFEEWGN